MALAKALGIEFDRKHRQPSTGASGPFKAFPTHGAFHLQTNLGALTLHAPLVNDRMPPDQVLLGRADVFAAYRITFDEIHKRMIMEPHRRRGSGSVRRTRTRGR
jgi:hypothetical protein